MSTPPTWAIIHEASQQVGANPAAREKQRFTETGRDRGAQIIDIPANWARHSDAETALSHIPRAPQPTPTFLSGYIHPGDEYEELFESASARNFILANDPDEYQRSHSMSESLPLLAELTPKSFMIDDLAELPAALAEIGLPAFVKGDVQSRKDRGWQRCVANTEAELETIAADLLDRYAWSEGRVVIRELVALKHSRTQADGFPIGREFRAIVFGSKVVGLGYYWPGGSADPLRALDESEERAVRELALQAASRVRVPFVVIDIGQLEDGAWIVIETGDPQTAGYGEIDPGQMIGEILSNLA